MIEIMSPWKSVRDKEKWAARGASFVTKAKATKMVWFPPKAVDTGKKVAATATEATKKTTKKTTDAAKKPTGAAKKMTGAGKKPTNSTTTVTNPVRRKKA
jgi:hypothetical protein